MLNDIQQSDKNKIKIKLAIQKVLNHPAPPPMLHTLFFFFSIGVFMSLPLLFRILIKIPINIHFNYVHHDDNNNNNKSLLYLSHSLTLFRVAQNNFSKAMCTHKNKTRKKD